jgi:glutathione peroxidase
MKMIWILVAAALVLVLVGGLWVGRAFSGGMTRASADDAASIYDLELTSLAGEPVAMSRYAGTVALVVNTASKCGLTPQYEGLEKLHRELEPEGFTVLGFPSNDFMGQEPGNPEEIMRFCRNTYDVTFPLFAKAKVTGDDRSEVFQRLAAELEEPTWNFTKYVVGKDGRVIARFGPRTSPDDPRLRHTIEQALAAD